MDALSAPTPLTRLLLRPSSSLDPPPQVGAVIVSPTRELARQIYEVARPYVDTVPWLRALLLVGGT